MTIILSLPKIQTLSTLSMDGQLLFGTRILRMFAYGFLSVVLGLYLIEVGLTERQAGIILTFMLLGDAGVSLWLTTHADRIGRRRILIAGTGLMFMAGIGFAATDHFFLLILAAIIGTISPSGNEVGAFLSIEQASLSQITPDQKRTPVFAWYNLAGSLATATGALLGGLLVEYLEREGISTLDSYRIILLIYAGAGLALGLLFTRLSEAVEVSRHADDHLPRIGLSHSRRKVFHLSGLFMLDAFAGGLIVQSLVAYWFHIRFGVETGTLGAIFFGANLLAGLSALAAALLAARFGLINTMVFTHIPSNLLLMFVPLMPSLIPAVLLLLIRYSISQMDVPTRQSYVMAVVDPSERSAAAGVTSIARTLGSAFSPMLTGVFFQLSWLGLPFVLAGSLKIVYDLALYRSFRSIKPPEEQEKEPVR